jgi:hypothetical protein
MIGRIICGTVILFLYSVATNNASQARANGAATTAAERRAAWQQHVELENSSPFKSLQWRAVGPKFQGGRIESIACPAGYTSTIYVGVGSGNVWKTVNPSSTVMGVKGCF